MATKYLDTTGLTYFWGKLKNYFQVKLISGTNIKTINNESLLGSGNITVQGGGGGGVTGVKGNSEVSYRTGDVNLTLTNLGIHISTSDPTSFDGNDGDIWLVYTAPEPDPESE